MSVRACSAAALYRAPAASRRLVGTGEGVACVLGGVEHLTGGPAASHRGRRRARRRRWRCGPRRRRRCSAEGRLRGGLVAGGEESDGEESGDGESRRSERRRVSAGGAAGVRSRATKWLRTGNSGRVLTVYFCTNRVGTLPLKGPRGPRRCVRRGNPLQPPGDQATGTPVRRGPPGSYQQGARQSGARHRPPPPKR